MKILVKKKDKGSVIRRIFEMKEYTGLPSRLRQRNRYYKYEYYYVREEYSGLSKTQLYENFDKFHLDFYAFYQIFQRA